MNDVSTISPPALIGLRGAGERLSLSTPRRTARQSGGYRSPFRGRGMEFEESRRYQAGDDIRNMDWRVTARTGEAHTKLYREERERPALFSVDFRRSMFFATRGAFKSVVACRLAALLAWHSNHQGDRVGGVLWSGRGHRELRPKRGARGALNLIRALCAFASEQPAGSAEEPSMESMASRLRRVSHPGSLVFVLSDFRGFDEPARERLAQTARHSDLVLIMIHDRVEADLPPPGRYLLRDDDREAVIDTASGEHRRRYHEQFLARCDLVQSFCRSASARFLSCSTDTDPVKLLRHRLAG